MKKTKGLCQADSGLFVRNLGKKITPSGKYMQHKFYLGRDEDKAQTASDRLERLWKQVCQRWERENEFEQFPTNEPVWDGPTLEIADALRNGAAVARVNLPAPLSAFIPESPFVANWVDRLQKNITVIRIELAEPEIEKASEATLKSEGDRLIEMGRRLQRRKAGGDTLHAAMERYKVWIQGKYVNVDRTPTPYCRTQERQVRFLKEHLPNEPLSSLDAQRIEEMIDLLRLRPITKWKRPASRDFTKSCIKRFRHFLRWLNKTNEFEWKRPSELDLPRVQIPLTAEEMTSRLRSTQIDTFKIEELKLLWEFAIPIQRLWMLLALNCGFGRAEIASLDVSELHLRSQHPHEMEIGVKSTSDDSWIRRVRGKSAVYGEFKLWPETVQALEWWLSERQAIIGSAKITTLLVNGNGHRFDRPTKSNHSNFQIPNSWTRLGKKIKSKHTTFRTLSFNKLRKTAGNLIRSHSDGEVAAVFLCHGTPVKGDELLDLYTNRPFAKVFAAIDRVGDALRTNWAGVTDPFLVEPTPQKALRPRPLNRAQKLKKQGFRVDYIAKALGIKLGEARVLARLPKEAPLPNEPNT